MQGWIISKFLKVCRKKTVIKNRILSYGFLVVGVLKGSCFFEVEKVFPQANLWKINQNILSERPQNIKKIQINLKNWEEIWKFWKTMTKGKALKKNSSRKCKHHYQMNKVSKPGDRNCSYVSPYPSLLRPVGNKRNKKKKPKGKKQEILNVRLYAEYEKK